MKQGRKHTGNGDSDINLQEPGVIVDGQQKLLLGLFSVEEPFMLS
jgi:hypothetical protein